MQNAERQPFEDLDDLYREVILDHYRNPRHRQPLPDPDVVAEGQNPFCGDEVRLQLKLEGERIVGVGLQGRGCSISVASASMMTEAIQGRTVEEARRLSRLFRSLMRGENLPPEALEDLGDLESLTGVRRFPVRVKCALLGWMTLEEALKEAEQKGAGG